MSRSDRGARRVSGCPAGAEGLWPCEGSSMYGQGHNPPPPIGGAPFTQGGHTLPLIELFWPRRGQSVGRRKSVKKNAALLHFLVFSSNDLLFGVPRGERLAAKTMAASLLRKPARAVIRPTGANIARSPVSLCSTVAPCSQPRNPLGRASRAIGSSGTFLLLFWSQKRRNNGNRPLKKGAAAWWQRPLGAI